jgi:hypothetical protein
MAVSVFIWTKIGTETGENIADIIDRKEGERSKGGVFWWGIGTSLGPAVRDEAQKSGGSIPIIFCEMLGTPQTHDVSPTSKVRWTKWRDWDGSEADIPYFVLVKSRGEDRSGKRKDKHYAVVCRSDNKLRLNPNGQLFDPRNCRTISGKLPGDSQNTALLSGDITQSHRNGRYRIAFAAMLVRPWQVILLSPIPV